MAFQTIAEEAAAIRAADRYQIQSGALSVAEEYEQAEAPEVARLKAEDQHRALRLKITRAVLPELARKLGNMKLGRDVAARVRSQRLAAPTGRQLAPRKRLAPTMHYRAI